MGIKFRLSGIILWYLVAISFNAAGQERCASMQLLSVYQQQNPSLQHKMQEMNRRILANVPLDRNRQEVPVITIPVVFHVIHNGEPLGSGANISDAQVLSQLSVLNEDFRRMNADTSSTVAQFSNVAADTKIEFCLAASDPNGNLTTGITRHDFGASSYNASTIDNTVKPSINWDAQSYLNFYIANLSGGLLGYATFPGGFAYLDGVVCGYKHVGRFPDNPNSNNYNLGRTATHEVGHWLGLYHTFQGGCGSSCNSSGDLVCDTPPVDNPNFGCSVSHASCGSLDMVQNYMDYADDACMNIFTAGQSDRMRAVLNEDRWSLQSSTGCQAPSSPPVAQFESAQTIGCPGASIQFNDLSSGNPTSWIWSFSGGSPTIATTKNPLVTFSNPGIYTVTLTASNAFGSDLEIKTGYVVISTSGILTPVMDDFEGPLLPPIGWSVVNPDELKSWAAASGIMGANGSSTAAMMMNHYNYNGNGAEDYLITPVIDLTAATAAQVSFDVAYAVYAASYPDGLKLEVSTDCGATFVSAGYDKNGSALSTVVGNTTTSWTPTAANNWRNEVVDLSAFSGGPVIIRFVSVNAYGNNLYLDNINITSNATLPCEVPENPDVTMNGTNDITLNWDFVPGADGYEIQGKPLNQNSWISLVINSNTNSKIINGIGDNTYEWKVGSLCSGGNISGFSPTDTFTIGCQLPENIMTSAIGSASVTLSWLALPDAERYLIQGRKAGSAGWISIQVLHPANTLPVSGLIPNTTYEWRIAAICDFLGGKISRFSEVQSFSTLGNLGSNKERYRGEKDHEFSMKAFPNPVSQDLYLKLINSDALPITYTLLDVSGSVLEQSSLDIYARDEVKLPMDNYAAGVYFVQISSPDQTQTIKILKQ